MLAVVVRSVFEEDGKFFLQVYLDECLYEFGNKNENKNKVNEN